MSVPIPVSGSGPDSDPASMRVVAEDAGQQVPVSPPDDPPRLASPGYYGGVVRRRRKRKKQPEYVGVIAAVTVLALIGVVLGVGVMYLVRHRSTRAGVGGGVLAGYTTDGAVLDGEFQHYYGKAPDNNFVAGQFQHAVVLVRERSFAEAVEVLESISRRAAVPVIFNDLGVLYAELNDRPHSETAFREALARDSKYGAVLANIKLKGFTADVAAPLTREVEPNNDRFNANLIAIGTPVEGEITASAGDIDFFRFSFPAAPRDVLSVELTNHDFRFSPRLDIYDGEARALDWGRKTAEPGNSLTVYGTSAPNSTIYVAISASDGSAGRYVLNLKPMKAYDQYEPDDDIFHAHKIEPQTTPDGRLEYAPIKANIMDVEDTDFYSFLAPLTGKMTVEVHNESVALIPAVQLYGPDMRSLGFGPTLRTPGESLQTSIDVEKSQTYYVQVWSQASTSGAYTLTVR
jgi:hypothetical protein